VVSSQRFCKHCGKPCNGSYCRKCFCSNHNSKVGIWSRNRRKRMV
jgi:hypothetical protein